MKKIMRLFLLPILSLFSCFLYASSVSVEHLSSLLKRFNTYSADFTQITKGENGRVLQSGDGSMLIKRPGKFRWESNKPTHQILITDGNTLWIYDVDLAQATKQKLSTRTTIDPAMLLSGSIKNLSDTFTVMEELDAKKSSFVLKPIKKDLGFSLIDLTFIDNQLVEMKVVNNLSQTTLFTFSKIKLNGSVEDSLFTFKAEPGVDVISQ